MLANKTITNFKPTNPNSLMPKEACLKLSPSARLTWNKLDADSKALILSARKCKADKIPTKPPHKGDKGPNRFTLAELHELLSAQYEPNDDSTNHEQDEEESTRLVNFTQAKEVTPGNIRKILSVPNEKGHNNMKKKA